MAAIVWGLLYNFKIVKMGVHNSLAQGEEISMHIL